MSEAYLRGTLALGARHSLVYEEPGEDAEAVAERATVDLARPPEPVAPARQRLLKSKIKGVSNEAWSDFVQAMTVGNVNTVSEGNEFGLYAMKPRRLADLKLIKDLRCMQSPTGRVIWVGEWIAPMTRDKFLGSEDAQYLAFSSSMQRYVEGLKSGDVPQPDDGWPEGMTVSGALGILHRCGPSGLRTWNDAANRFPATVELFEKVNGIF